MMTDGSYAIHSRSTTCTLTRKRRLLSVNSFWSIRVRSMIGWRAGPRGCSP